MKTSLAKNYIYNLSYQLLVLIVPLVTMPYVSRVLGDYNVGVFNFIQAIVGYFVLLGCVGLNLYGQREIAACGDDLEKRSRVFAELQILRTVTVGTSFLLYTLGVTLFVQEIQIYYYLFSVEIFASVLDISWFFQGIEQFKIQTIRNVLVKMTGVAGIFLFVKSRNDLGIYILCYTATILLGNGLLWLCLRKELVRTHVEAKGLVRHIKPTLLIFLPQIATSIYAQLDKTMIKFLSDYNQVAYYSQAEKIVKLILTVVTAMGLVMLSRIAVSYSRQEQGRIEQYIHNSFRYLFFLMWPCTFGCVAIARNFVPWYFEDGFEAVAPCMMVLCPIVVLIGLSNTLRTQYLIPTNQMKVYTMSVVTGAVVNAVFNAALIPFWGAIGAAVATVMAEAAVTGVQFWHVRKVFSPKILLEGWKNFVSALIMGAAAWAVGLRLPGGVTTTFIQVGVGMVVYVVCLALLRDDFMRQMVRRVLRRGRS